MKQLDQFKQKYPHIYFALEFNLQYLGRLVITIFSLYGIAILMPSYLTYLIIKYGFLGQGFGILSILFVMFSILNIMVWPLFKTVVKGNGQEDS